MELKRILAKDSRTAMDIAMSRYGRDVLVVSSQSVAGQVELVVALDVQPPPPPPSPTPSHPSAFTQAFRQALGPMPEPQEPAADATAVSPDAAGMATFEPAAVPVLQAQAPADVANAVAAVAAAAVAEAARPAPMATVAPSDDPSATQAATPAEPKPAPAVAGVFPAQAMVPAPAADTGVDTGIDTASTDAPAPLAAVGPTRAAAVAPEDLRGQQAIELVRREIAALRQEFALSRQVQAWQDGQAWEPAVAPVIAALHDVGVPAGLRALLADSARDALDADEALGAMRALLSQSLSCLPQVKLACGVHAVCGPTGAGKTLMVSRLAGAAAQHLGAQRVALVVFDDNRSGAWSQMQVLAAQAGVKCFRAADADTLRLLLDELGNRDMVLIDTAGADCLAQAERLRAVHLPMGIHALLPADASIGSVRRVLAADQAWTSVMVSKVDESEAPWPLMQALCDRQVPVSCMGASDDMEQPPEPFDGAALAAAGFDRLRADLAALSARVSAPAPEAAPPARARRRAAPVRAKADPVATPAGPQVLAAKPQARSRKRVADAPAVEPAAAESVSVSTD